MFWSGRLLSGRSPGDVWWKKLEAREEYLQGSEESGVLEEQLENQCGWNRVTE